MNTKRVCIVGGTRTPFVKSFTHFSKTTNQEMLTACLKNLVEKFHLKGEKIGDVAFGAIMTHSTDWNLSREVVLGSGLSADTPAYNVQRACGTSLETVTEIANKIAVGQIEVGIAGGTDTNSDLPVMIPREVAWKLLDLRNAKSGGERLKRFFSFGARDLRLRFPSVTEPRTGLSMGEHCEKMVKEWKISREDQDKLAFESHQKAAAAYKEGFYNDLITEFKGLKKDALVREDTTLEKLARLKPAFDFTGKGTLTAGNSTPLTDGASMVLLCSEEYAKRKGWKVLAYFKDAQVSAVDFVNGEGLLMAPTLAVSEMLTRQKMSLQDFTIYEIHEAFAGQVLCTLKAWESAEYCERRLNTKPLGSIDRNIMNIKGGSVALGHPFAATGARIVASLAKILDQKGSGVGLISICTAGGMGQAAILEK